MTHLFHGTIIAQIACTLSLFWMSNSVRAETDAVAMQRAERFQVTQGKAKVYLVGGKLGFGGPFDPTMPRAELMVNNVGVVITDCP